MATVTTDPIADMLTRIRNALAVNHQTVTIPYSQVKEEIAKLLKKHNYIVSYTVDKNGFKNLVITLSEPDRNNPITTLRRVSKPGRRMYVKAHEIPRIMRGHGLVIVSTSQGLMSDHEARRQRLGGEVMCMVW